MEVGGLQPCLHDDVVGLLGHQGRPLAIALVGKLVKNLHAAQRVQPRQEMAA